MREREREPFIHSFIHCIFRSVSCSLISYFFLFPSISLFRIVYHMLCQVVVFFFSSSLQLSFYASSLFLFSSIHPSLFISIFLFTPVSRIFPYPLMYEYKTKTKRKRKLFTLQKQIKHQGLKQHVRTCVYPAGTFKNNIDLII